MIKCEYIFLNKSSVEDCMKKLLFITNDINNNFIRYLIKNLSKKINVSIFSQKEIKLNNIKYIKDRYRPNIIIDKIINYFSNPFPSKKELFYLKFSILKKKSLHSLLLRIKFFLSFINFLPSKDFIYKYYFFFSNEYKNLLKNYDIVLCDSRLNNIYNNNKKIIYESIKNKKIKVISWCYSWDNIYQNSIIKSADYILIWSNYFRKLVNKIHQYNDNQIVNIGAVQFDYLKKKIKTHYKEKYILFVSSYGSDINNTGDNFLKDEIYFLIKLSKLLNKIDRNINIVVRPYPSSKKNSYNQLKKFKNIKIKEYGKYLLRKNKYNEKIRFEYSFNRKIKQILESKIIISFGSTFNIEGAYFNKIILHINYSNYHFSNYNLFKKDMENLKILSPEKFPNIINNDKQLSNILIELLVNKKNNKYKKYNKYIKKIFFNDNINQFAVNNLIKKITSKSF